MSLSEETIAALFAENRRFDPPADIAKNAVLNDPGIYERATGRARPSPSGSSAGR
jgi:hypothetical protein